MIRNETEIPIQRDTGAPSVGGATTTTDLSLGELFKRLTTDMGELVRQEAALAKAELGQATDAVTRNITKIAIGGVLALAGMLAVTAFLVVLLGTLLANYWLAALIVGVVMLAIGGLLAMNAISDMKKHIKPEQTIATLREDSAWASQQARELKRDLTSKPSTDPATPHARR